MKIIGARIVKFGIIGLLVMALVGCEPISVSVNALGDIVFARAEGIFFQDGKTGKVVNVTWNQGQPGVPVLVRWSPDNETIAFTTKPSKDAQAAELYVVKKTGGNPRQLLSLDKVVTQMEWSPDGKYLTIAQQGEDSDLGVADLNLVDAATGMSKVVVKNCGDVHNWLDEKTIALIKVASKHSKNSDLLIGRLSLYRLDAGDLKGLLDVKATTTGGLDANPASRTIAFTALQTGPESQEFIPGQFSKTEIDAMLDKIYDEDQKATLTANYTSSDKKTYRLKKGLDQETLDTVYDALNSGGAMDASLTAVYLVKAPDAKSLDAKSLEVKAEKLTTGPANFVQFSPDGTNLLLKVKVEDAMELGSWNLSAKSYKTLAKDVTDAVSSNSSSVKVYPTWQNNGSALFFRENRVYGSNGLALTLMSVETASLKLRNLQAAIDVEVNRQVEAKGGY